MKNIEVTGKNLEEAINTALKELNVGKDEIEYEIIEENSKKGLFGIFSGKSFVKLRVTVKEQEKVTEEEPVIEVIQEEKVIAEDDTSIEEDSDVKTLLKDILQKMDLTAEIAVQEEGDVIRVNMSGSDVGSIIGYRGETLDALQYLVSLAINRHNEGNRKKLILDAENYRHKREETLRRVADKTAYKVIQSRRKYRLEPMNPYERRIIHAALQDNNKVCTYSEGEEPYRRVVVDLKK